MTFGEEKSFESEKTRVQYGKELERVVENLLIHARSLSGTEVNVSGVNTPPEKHSRGISNIQVENQMIAKNHEPVFMPSPTSVNFVRRSSDMSNNPNEKENVRSTIDSIVNDSMGGHIIKGRYNREMRNA